MYDFDKLDAQKCGVTPREVQRILKKHGEDISLDESKKVLDLMCFFAKLAVNQIVVENESS
ncbi:hypothetical protein [Echinicola vietnamensis]|uniref:Uncharacterized protein n=1 Tax=Echinicola vietnamensis (strain DSM 17526 / LMG 23754 / KMM 6221) TaxID=926556 RepID=L0FYR6_ECHVK|nr:hypothetical protein [Echinicola vietnamensis]AGA78183.1 hypothetical protein Echvi_1929 [Echinicola vietnamensis DSM 17526]